MVISQSPAFNQDLDFQQGVEDLAATAKTMMGSLAAMQLRTLQTIEAPAGSASNTVLMVPADVLDMLKIKNKPAET